MRIFRAAMFLILVGGSAARAGDWPQWRGPDGDGVSPEKGLPTRWSVEENVAWKLPLPEWSGSTPIVWRERIFLNVADGERLELWCVDRASGRPLWKKQLGTGNRKYRKQNLSSPSPVTDGEGVWTMTGTGVLAGFDFQGRELWKRDIQEEYGTFGLNWGYASSPLLHGDTLYVQVLHGMKTDDPSYLLAIDKRSGQTKWRVERPTDAIMESPDAYTTPALLRGRQGPAIVVAGGDYVTGHDPETGREIWRQGGLNPERQKWYRIVASPLAVDGMVYASSRQKPFLALGTGDGEIRRTWSTDQGPDVPTPVCDGRFLYILEDNGVLWKLDAKTGVVQWGPRRLRPGTYSASPVLADGKLYAVSEEGVTSVVSVGAEFEVLAENHLEGYTLSSPAVSDGQLFIRTDKFLFCIGERKQAAINDNMSPAGKTAARWR